MLKTILVFIVLSFLAACGGMNIPLAVNTPLVTPSSPPAILSPTPPFIPSVAPSTTALPSIINRLTEVPTTIPSTLTTTSLPIPSLSLDILGCNTSIDVTHQMGEVTNAYPLIRNSTNTELTNVCAKLTASDEGRIHPDKTSCVASLPHGLQVMLKLTVDTGFEQDTSIRVDVSSKEGFTVSLTRSSCLDLGMPGWVPDKIGVIEPIP